MGKQCLFTVLEMCFVYMVVFSDIINEPDKIRISNTIIYKVPTRSRHGYHFLPEKYRVCCQAGINLLVVPSSDQINNVNYR